jgi:hypothetical protein
MNHRPTADLANCVNLADAMWRVRVTAEFSFEPQSAATSQQFYGEQLIRVQRQKIQSVVVRPGCQLRDGGQPRLWRIATLRSKTLPRCCLFPSRRYPVEKLLRVSSLSAASTAWVYPAGMCCRPRKGAIDSDLKWPG